MTEYGKFSKKKSPTPPAVEAPLYPESKRIRKELIEAVIQRRREVCRKFYQRANEEHEDK